jgi:hypothetical protein
MLLSQLVALLPTILLSKHGRHNRFQLYPLFMLPK